MVLSYVTKKVFHPAGSVSMGKDKLLAGEPHDSHCICFNQPLLIIMKDV